MRKYLCYAILILIQIYWSVSAPCLNPKQAESKCSSCSSQHFHSEGTCYEKLKGCSQHKVKLQQVTCAICQSGYTLNLNKCEREAVVQLKKGESLSKLLSPALIASGSHDKIASQQVKQVQKNSSSPNSQKQASQPLKQKPVPKFPQISIVSNISQEIMQKPVQVSHLLQQKVQAEFPLLAKETAIKLSGSSAKSMQLLLFKGKNKILLSGAHQASSINEVATSKNDDIIVDIGCNPQTIQLLEDIQALKSNKIVDELDSVQISIGLSFKTAQGISTKVRINLGNGQLTGDDSAESQSTLKHIQRLIKSKVKYEQYLMYAYSQFQNNLSVVNPPQQIQSVMVQMVENTSQILFSVHYFAANKSESEKVVFRYSIPNNETQVQGYFIEGVNILNYFKNGTNQTKIQNADKDKDKEKDKTQSQSQKQLQQPKQKESKDTNIKNQSEDMKNNEASKIQQSGTNSDKVQKADKQIGKSPLIQTKQQIIKQSNSKQTVESDIKQQQKPASIVTPTQSIQSTINQNDKKQQKQNIQKEPAAKQVDKILKPQQTKDQTQATEQKPTTADVKPQQLIQAKSSADVLAALKKSSSEFTKKSANGFRMGQFQSQINQDKAEVSYNIKFLFSSGAYSLKAIQNVKTGQLLETYTLESADACADITTDALSVKLDAVLKKSFPLLSGFGKLAVNYKIQDTGERFSLLYANEQYKKVYYDVVKSKDSAKYVISKSGILQNGFVSDKNVDLLNMRIADYELTTDERAEARHVRSVLNQLIQRFKPYVIQCTIAAVLNNVTHNKIYLTNKFVTYQFTKKVDDLSKGTLSVLDTKTGYEVWPMGVKQDILSIQSITYRKIEEQMIKKYKSYFSSNNVKELMIKKLQQSYEVAFKTLFSYYSVTVSTSADGTISLGALKKTTDFDEPKLTISCNNSEIMDAEDKKCYRKITGCSKQLGNICIVCELGFSALGFKQCKRNCIY